MNRRVRRGERRGDRALDYIYLAIPVFFVLIGIEFVAGLLMRRRLYRFNDSINDLSMGIIDQVGSVFLKTAAFGGYLFVYAQWRVLDMTGPGALAGLGAAGMWAGCFLAQDFMYYWAHRMSHEMNIGWAVHIAHHQSEEYNLSVALRQGVFQPLFFGLFYLPLALAGFPPLIFLAVSQVNALYQFWIHTRAIPKLGPLEWFLNTPSHHRVHHASDAKYVDRNHGGTLIVWDRLFGTFQKEEEEPRYGIVTPLASWNPLWGQVHYLAYLFRTCYAARGWRDKLLVWVKPPAWRPAGLEPKESASARAESRRKYDARAPLSLNLYVAAHFAAILLLSIGFLGSADNMTGVQRVAGAVLVFATLTAFGAIFEARRWALLLEPVRLCALAACLLLYGGGFYGWESLQGPYVHAAILTAAGVSLLWLAAHWRHFVPATGIPRVPAETRPDSGGSTVA
jgi:sterol desaturase/sphingolipid hydroxylase (fatty acid hydroxylase superfamily)